MSLLLHVAPTGSLQITEFKWIPVIQSRANKNILSMLYLSFSLQKVETCPGTDGLKAGM